MPRCPNLRNWPVPRRARLRRVRFLAACNFYGFATIAYGPSAGCSQPRRCSSGRIIANDRPLIAPSTPDCDYDYSALAGTGEELGRMGAATGGKKTVYKEMGYDDIAWLINTWAEAAGRIARAGADAIEIHVAHGYILGVFLNRRDNHRTDKCGGSLANRARLACEVIAAVKERVRGTPPPIRHPATSGS